MPGLDVKPLIAELQARAVEELDYQLEAEAQRAFAAEFRDDPDIVVPDVVAGVRHRVLVTEWMESSGSLARVIREGTQEERDHYGLLLRAVPVRRAPAAPGCCTPTRTPATSGLIPAADGSPGRLGVLDYGAVARLPGPGAATLAGRADPDRPDGGLRPAGHRAARRGLRRASGSSIDAEQLRAYLGPFLEPASVEEFQFSRSWMQQQFRRINDPRGDAYAAMLRLNLPPAYMLIHRTFAGGVGVLSQLEARVPFRSVLLDSLPGFAD